MLHQPGQADGPLSRRRASSPRAATPTSRSSTPTKRIEVDHATMETNADWSPYQGWSLAGFAETTFCRGRKIVDEYKFVGESGWGRWLPRERAGSLEAAERAALPRSELTIAAAVASRSPRQESPMFRAGDRQSPELLKARFRRRAAAALARRGAGRGRALPVLLRRPLHPGLPDAHRRPRVHPPDPPPRRALGGPDDPRGQHLRRELRPRLPDRGALRGGLRRPDAHEGARCRSAGSSATPATRPRERGFEFFEPARRRANGWPSSARARPG